MSSLNVFGKTLVYTENNYTFVQKHDLNMKLSHSFIKKWISLSYLTITIVCDLLRMNIVNFVNNNFKMYTI